MAGPRSFIEKKTVPGLGVPTSIDRNLRLALENIIENLRHILGRVKNLEDTTVTDAQATATTTNNNIVNEGVTELFDLITAPTDAPDTYLRFVRDGDGDVQRIYLGTVT